MLFPCGFFSRVNEIHKNNLVRKTINVFQLLTVATYEEVYEYYEPCRVIRVKVKKS